MPLTDSGKNKALAGFATSVRTAALFSGSPTTAANELSGGSPAYTRRPVTFKQPAGGALTLAANPQFDVPAGSVIQYVAFFGSARDLLAWYALTPQTFDVQSTYTLQAVEAGNIVLVDGTEIEPEPGTINLLTTSAEVTQGATLTLQASRTDGASGIARVDYAIAGGPSGTITWAANESGTQTIRVAMPADMDTGDAAITLSNPVNASLGSTTIGTVTVNAAVVPSAGEIVLLTTSVSVQVGGTYEVQCLRQNGSTGAASATATVTDSDGQSHTFNWAAGEGGIKSQTFTAPANAGTYQLSLTSVSGASTGDVTEGAVTVIAVNHGRIDLVLTSQTIDAGDKIVVRAERSQGSDGLASVDYALSTGEEGTLTWLDGESGTKQATIATTGGASIISHDVTITLSNAKGVALGTASGSATVQGPSGTINLDTTGVTVTEGEDATLKFTRDGGKNGAVGAKYSLSNGASGTITWADKDDAPKTETIPTQAGDGGSTWTVTLDSVMGAAKGTDSGTITVKVPEAQQPGTVSLVTTSIDVAAGDSYAITFRRKDGDAGAAVAYYSTSDGQSGEVSWSGGESGQKSATLTTTAGQAGATVTVTLDSVDGATKGTPDTCTVSITAEESPGEIVIVGSVISATDNSKQAITLRRQGGSKGFVGVKLATADGTAKAGTDYHQTVSGAGWQDGDTADKIVYVPIGKPQVADGTLITSVTTDGPCTFGLPFAEGAVPDTVEVVGATHAQVDRLSSHRDGSARFARVTIMDAAGGTFDIKTKSGVTNTPAALPAFTFKASFTDVEDSTEYALSIDESTVPEFSAGGDELVLNEYPLTRLKDASDNEHKVLGKVYVWYYPTTDSLRVTVNLRNSDWKNIDDKQGTIKYTLNGSEVLSRVTTLVQFQGTRWSHYWRDGDTEIGRYCGGIDLVYLKSTKAVPNFDPTLAPTQAQVDAVLSAYDAANNDLIGESRSALHMGATGGREDIAQFSQWDARPFVDLRFARECLGVNEASACWPIHIDDTRSGHFLSIIDEPLASLINRDRSENPLPDGSGRKTYSNERDFSTDQSTAHEPSWGYAAYILSADPIYRDECHAWTTYNLISLNYSARNQDKGHIVGQTRAIGWGIRNLAMAAAACPDDHALRDDLYQIAANNAEYGITRWMVADVTTPGYLPNNIGAGRPYIAPWQEDYVIFAACFAVDLGFAGFEPFKAYKLSFIKHRMQDYCFQCATTYHANCRDSDGTTLYQSWPYMMEKSLTAERFAAPCGHKFDGRSGYLENDMSGYPWNHDGYQAYAQPSVAYEVDAGIDGANTDWQNFNSGGNRATRQAAYVTNPGCAIVPRSL